MGEVVIAVAAIGSGPRIVMLPSVGRDVDDFLPVAHRLADAGYRALMPTPRGIGDSRGPMSGIGLADLAEDVAEVIRQDQGGRGGPGRAHGRGRWSCIRQLDRADGGNLSSGSGQGRRPPRSGAS